MKTLFLTGLFTNTICIQDSNICFDSKTYLNFESGYMDWCSQSCKYEESITDWTVIRLYDGIVCGCKDYENEEFIIKSFYEYPEDMRKEK